LLRCGGCRLISNQISRPSDPSGLSDQKRARPKILATLDQPNDILHRPQPRFDPRRHRRTRPQRLVDANEVVPERIESNHVRMVFELLAESIRESGEAPHRHPPREVRTFRVGRADVLRVRIAGDILGTGSDAL
jgi:hypothetical protein